MKITVVVSNSEQLLFEVKLLDTIENVKAMISLKKDIQKKQQKLYIDGIELEDRHSLIDYNIQEGTKLHLCIGNLYNNIEIYVRTSSGKIITLHVNEVDDTIEHVKGQIQALERIPPKCQHFTFDGKQLESTFVLFQYNIKHKSTIYLKSCPCEVFKKRIFPKRKIYQLKPLSVERDGVLSTALDLSNLLESREFSDVVLVTTDDTGKCYEFAAHRAILSSRSPVFRKMFETNMKEKTEGRVKITEFDTKVIHEVLRYIYSGKINTTPKTAKDILIAADYYELEPLKQKMGLACEKRLTRDNVFEYLMFADTYNVQRLKQAAIELIINIDNVTETEEFNRIPNSHMYLMKDILVAFAKK